jgi:hypothetical protein
MGDHDMSIPEGVATVEWETGRPPAYPQLALDGITVGLHRRDPDSGPGLIVFVDTDANELLPTLVVKVNDHSVHGPRSDYEAAEAISILLGTAPPGGTLFQLQDRLDDIADIIANTGRPNPAYVDNVAHYRLLAQMAAG